MAISLQVVSETEIKVLNNDTISVVARLLYVLVNGQEPFIPQLSSDPAGVVTVSFSETGIAGRQKFVAGDTFELVTTRTDVETPVLGAVVDQTAPIALTAEDLAPVKTVNKQTIDLPLGNALAINTTRGWTNINAPMDGSLLPDPSGSAQLVSLFFLNDGRIFMNMSSDLSNAFETNGGIDIIVNEVTYSFDLKGADRDEPYAWTPSNGDDQAALFAVLATAMAAQVCVRDGPLADAGRRGAYRGARRLTGIYVGAKPANVYRGDKQIWARP